VSSLRDRYNAFIARHEVAWELAMGALAAAFVTVGFAADVASLAMQPIIEFADIVLTVIFVAEFSTRFAAARDRRAYLRGHWIDLVALIPTARGVRLLRLLRLLRLIRTFAGMYRAISHFERIAGQRDLLFLFMAWLGVAVISSIALFLAEVEVNDAIADPVDALWWGVVTLTTVGYGDVYPITPEGRLAAAALMILGITLFAAITGTITSYIVARRTGLGEEAASTDPLSVIRRLGELHADGHISADDFEVKKAELLARL
jgi:voltage-gated potassium channel